MYIHEKMLALHWGCQGIDTTTQIKLVYMQCTQRTFPHAIFSRGKCIMEMDLIQQMEHKLTFIRNSFVNKTATNFSICTRYTKPRTKLKA